MKHYSTTVIALYLSLFSLTALAEMPMISDARINQPPPGTAVAAGFFTISNPGDEPLIITGASSDMIGKIEVHLTTVVDDVARMKEQMEVVIEPGASLKFEHGSYHLMLMRMDNALVAGDSIAISLDTNVGPVAINMPVVKPGMSMPKAELEMKIPDSEHDMATPKITD
ncbi:MAG: copper chaperone PCu(A)C [Granulosicoccus sp.]